MIGFVRKSAEGYITEMLAGTDIRVNGNRPWDIRVKNSAFFDRIMAGGSLALGESYMDGWWECEALDHFIFLLLRGSLEKNIRTSPSAAILALKARLLNRQNMRRAYQVGREHYDIGNDLFDCMLDRHMIYSCGYWKDADDLDAAQEAKMDLICRKLELEPGMRLLDIGCGWGGLLGYAARHYGVEGVGVTVSGEQADLAGQRCAGLPVEIQLRDYRNIRGKFDSVVSVGMFEHVGYKNYGEFMKVARRCLGKGGLFLLHSIASNRTVHSCDPWFDRYIFPNGMLPSIKQVGEAVEDTFIMEDWHNLGVDYDRTLMAWYENFERNWPQLRGKYGDRFFRMWRYYLLALAGGFRARHMNVWQIVLSPNGRIGGYTSLRCPGCTETDRETKTGTV
jgi:cyclopropane-fatty-acyl-phospholipid synthase